MEVSSPPGKPRRLWVAILLWRGGRFAATLQGELEASMKPQSQDDRVAAALALIKARKKWEARTLLLDELRITSERRNEVLTILDKHFPLSERQQKALAEIGRSTEPQPGALEVMLDAPDPRFTDSLVSRAEDEPKALEVLLRVREAYAGDALSELFGESVDPVVARAIERIRAGAGEAPAPDVEPPPPPADVPEDRLWGLVDDVRRADADMYGPSEGELKSTARRKPSTKKKVRSARR
jgi:hypothetical protein